MRLHKKRNQSEVTGILEEEECRSKYLVVHNDHRQK